MRPEQGADLSSLTVQEDLPGLGYVAVTGREADVESESVGYAPDPILELDEPAVDSAVPDDASESLDEPLVGLQWDKQDLSIPAAHDVTRGEGVRVAVIDSGIAADHPDLDDVNLDLSKNFSGDGLGVGYPYGGYHGTHVSGIIAANDQNETGVLGTAPGAELVDCRVFPYGEGAPFSVILAAILHSVEVDADVANMSLGAYAPRRAYVDDGRFGQFYGGALNSALTHAKQEGTLVVMSAGNSGADLQHDGQWISLPNEGATGLSISATGPIGFGWGDPGLESDYASPAFYTNYGTNAIDLGAPGGDADLEFPSQYWYLDLVLSTVAEFERNEDGEIIGDASYSYSWAAGTSMAAPNVSGAAALVLANNPGYSPAQVESALKEAADVPSGYDKAYYGSGYLNVLDAL
ncbi:S8 family peptidase [Haloarchaeobius sp. HRN-SO-5]|uniref:S8 family peptidase n=1 Tax=Haloarchaeobius sp. HRN-SO-5 TaxID=3446118 RepID=UPI003EBF9F0E